MTLEDGVVAQHARATAVKGTLLACVVLAAVAIVLNVAKYQLLSGAVAGVSITAVEAAASNSRDRVIAALQLLLSVRRSSITLSRSHSAIIFELFLRSKCNIFCSGSRSQLR